MHTQGKLSTIGLGSTPLATTHAHAGQTDAFSARIFWSWNHPCTRGADASRVERGASPLEPPMHTRGRLWNWIQSAIQAGTTHAHAGQTHITHEESPQGGGTTHAHAGQTQAARPVSPRKRNHPCTRGADVKNNLTAFSDTEPPMHTRGRRTFIFYSLSVVGTTHAHAGQTKGLTSPSVVCRNHPCTRGADDRPALRVCVRLEPPMHTRGRRINLHKKMDGSGTTHAHAGQTEERAPMIVGHGNHPCTRGRRLLTRYNVRMSAKLYSVACIMQ